MSAGRVAVGHPVDVGSGAVFTLSTDFHLPGAVGVRWRRHYSTAAAADQWLGPKWTVPYFMRLDRVADGYVLSGAHGEQVPFAAAGVPLRPGKMAVNLSSNMELHRDGDGYRVLHWHHGGDVRLFLFAPRDDGHMPLAAIADLYGHRVRVDYDRAGRPTRLVQELEQRTVEIEYDGRGLIAGVYFAGDAGRKLLVRYEYDGGRRLTAAFDAAGHRKGYEYDARNRMTAETNPLGGKFSFAYDAHGRCVHTAGTGGYLERTLRYHTAPKMTRVTDTRGGVSLYYLNPAGQVVQVVDPTGAVTTRTFDEHCRLTGLTKPDGARETYAYDDQGNRAAEVDPAGVPTATAHDPLHRSTDVVDGNGFEWDVRGRHDGTLSGVENLPPREWAYTRDHRGLVVAATSPAGWVVRVRRDPHFRWVEQTDAAGLVRRTEYDEYGSVTEVRDAAGVVSHTRYDDLRRPVEETGRGGEVVRYRWNANHQLTERAGPGGRLDTWVYDRFGNRVGEVNALGETTTFEFDKEGHPVGVVNRAGERFEMRRDRAGRVVEERLFDGRVQRYEYDPCGRVVKEHRSDGRTVTRKYDPCGRLAARASSDGLAEAFEYDRAGRTVKAANAHGEVELLRDRYGRIAADVQAGRPVWYRYDADGHRTARHLPAAALGCRVVRVLDARGRVRAVHDQRGACQEYQWDAADRLVSRHCPGGMTEAFTYTAGRVHEHRVAGDVVTHAYDAGGNLVAVRDGAGGATEYTYDPLDRIRQVRRDGVVVESYEYDPNDAIRATHRGDRELTAGGRVVRDGTAAREYGDDGAVKAVRAGAAVASFRHDVDGRLVEVVAADGTITRHEYDPFGRRTATDTGGVRTEFLWDGWQLAAEVRDGEVTRAYLCADLRPVAEWRNGRRRTPVLDHRGAVRRVYDEAGAVRWTCGLDAYGNVTAAAGDAASPFRLVGQYHDAATGLHYNFHRHYDPRVGDYTAPDPIGLSGGHHFYAYPRNPLRWHDPFGLECQKDDCPDLKKSADGPDALANPPVKPAVGTPKTAQEAIAQAKKNTGNYVLYKFSELESNPGLIRPGERVLDLPDRPITWAENEAGLKIAMAEGQPIRDGSPTQTGGYLQKERECLTQNGWKYDPETGNWNPPPPPPPPPPTEPV